MQTVQNLIEISQLKFLLCILIYLHTVSAVRTILCRGRKNVQGNHYWYRFYSFFKLINYYFFIKYAGLVLKLPPLIKAY